MWRGSYEASAADEAAGGPGGIALGIVRRFLHASHSPGDGPLRSAAPRPWHSGLRDDCVARADGALSQRLQDARTSTSSPVVLIGFELQDAREISDLLPGRHSIKISSASQQNSWTAIPPRAFVLFNADHYDDLGVAVDVLMKLRKQRQDLVVILATTSVRGDDLSLERGAICHATLKLPTRFGNVERVIRSAAENAASLSKQGC